MAHVKHGRVAHGAWCMVCMGAWCSKHGAWCMVHGVWCMCGMWCKVWGQMHEGEYRGGGGGKE